MIFEALTKSKTVQNKKKGRKKFIQAKIGNILIWKHPALFQCLYRNLLYRCLIGRILAAMRRRLENLQP